MIDFTIEIEIARPVADVFAYVTDLTKLPTWQTSTVSAIALDDSPLGVGTRLREVHRAPGGRQLESLVKISAYEIDRAFELHVIEGALPLDAQLTFESIEQGTRVSFRAHGQPTGALRFAQPLLRRLLKRQFENYCAILKRLLEADAIAGTATRRSP